MAHPDLPLCNADHAAECAARIAAAKQTLLRALARQAAREIWAKQTADTPLNDPSDAGQHD